MSAPATDDNVKVGIVAGLLIVPYLAAAILINVIFGLVWAWVFVDFWGWFVAPVFTLPVLTLIQAYGLFLTARLFRPYGASELTLQKIIAKLDDDPKPGWLKRAAKTTFYQVVGPLLFWLVGYLIHSYGLPWPWR